MKKISFLMCLSILLSCIFSITSLAASSEVDKEREPVNERKEIIVYQTSMTDEEIEAEHRRQVTEYMASLGIDENEFIFAEDGISPLNDVADYMTTSSEQVLVSKRGLCGGQDPGGLKIVGGGYAYFTKTGGPSLNTSVSFESKYGTLSVGIPMGTQTGIGMGGVMVPIPNYRYWHVYSTCTYKVQAHITYKKQYNENGAPGYTWVKYSGPYTSKVHYRTAFDTVYMGDD